MAMGIVGRKAGMTRIFTEDGASVPVTVIEATPNRVSQVRTLDSDGYQAIQAETYGIANNQGSREYSSAEHDPRKKRQVLFPVKYNTAPDIG